MSITTVLNGETVTNPNINNAVVNAVSGSTIFIDDEKISQSLYNGTAKAPVWVVTDTVIDAPVNTSGNPTALMTPAEQGFRSPPAVYMSKIHFFIRMPPQVLTKTAAVLTSTAVFPRSPGLHSMATRDTTAGRSM